MSYLARLKELDAEKRDGSVLQEVHEGASCTSCSTDGERFPVAGFVLATAPNLAGPDQELSRSDAETHAFERAIVEWLNRNPAPSAPGWCAGCGKPEAASAVVVPFGTSGLGHAWLHPGCWPAWYAWRREEALAALNGAGLHSQGRCRIAMRDTRWKRGQPGNPKGNALETRNKATMAAQALHAGEADALSRKAVELALGGDTTALRLCLERLIPTQKNQPVVLDLPVPKTAAEIGEAQAFASCVTEWLERKSDSTDAVEALRRDAQRVSPTAVAESRNCT